MIAVALAGLLVLQWAEPPYLVRGDRVRVHVVGRKHGGTLTSYATGHSLALERDKFLFTYPSPEAVSFHWIDVQRLDVAAGRDWLAGAVKGAGLAFIAGAGLSLNCAVLGGIDGCPFWQYVGGSALVTVPVGAIVGSRFTRWKPIYKRKR